MYWVIGIAKYSANICVTTATDITVVSWTTYIVLYAYGITDGLFEENIKTHVMNSA